MKKKPFIQQDDSFHLRTRGIYRLKVYRAIMIRCFLYAQEIKKSEWH